MGKKVKLVIKIIVALLCLLIVWRVLLAEDESIFGDFMPTKATAELYKANETLTILTNDVVDEISEGGYFSVYGVYYTPETKELQVTVRYNDNTLDVLGDISFYAYTVDTTVAPAETQLGGTPADKSAGGDRLHLGYPIGAVLTPIQMGEDEKLFYNYTKLIFEGLEIDENTNVIISLCKKDDSEAEHAVISAHFAEQPMKEYKLSRSEKEALLAYEG